MFAEVQDGNRFSAESDCQRNFRIGEIFSRPDGLETAFMKFFHRLQNGVGTVVAGMVVGEHGCVESRQPDNFRRFGFAVEIRSAFRDRRFPAGQRSFPLDQTELRVVQIGGERFQHFARPSALHHFFSGTPGADVSRENEPEQRFSVRFPKFPNTVFCDHLISPFLSGFYF